MSSQQAGTVIQAQGEPQCEVIKRTLCVHICGSLTNLAMAGPQAATWRPTNGRETMLFCPNLDKEADPADAVNRLRCGRILKVTVKGEKSDFPCHVGVRINCVPASEVTDLGDSYTYTVLPGTMSTSPNVVYEQSVDASADKSWREMYSKWNASNLETEGVIDVNNQPFLFVHKEHPAIGLLRHNAEKIGGPIDKMPLLDGEWYKLTRQVMGTCVDTLRTKVLKNVMTQDLNMFSLQLHRLNAEGWDDLNNGVVALKDYAPLLGASADQVQAEKEHLLRQFVTKPYTYMARIEIEYELPQPTLR